MPSPAPEPNSPRPLTIWLVNPFDDIPGEGAGVSRTLSLARVLAARGHEVTWWSSTWSHRRKAVRRAPPALSEDEEFAIRFVAVRGYERDVSLARLASRRDFGRTLERLVTETIASGQLQRPDVIVATLPPLAGAEACVRLARRLDTTLVVDLPELWPETRATLLPLPAVLRQLLGPWLLGGMRRRRDAVLAAADAVAAASTTELSVVLPVLPPAAAPRTDPAAAPATATPLASAPGRAVPRHICVIGAYIQEFATAGPHVEPVPLPGTGIEAAAPPRALECVHTISEHADRDAEMLTKIARLLGSRGAETVIHVVVPEAGHAPLERVAEKLRGACRLVVHRQPDRRAYVDLLGGCDVGLVGLSSGCGVAVPVAACEYAAAGLALVSGVPGDLAAHIDRFGAGVACAADDAGMWADALASLATDRRRLVGLRDGARRLAAAVFDRETTSARFATWLEAVAVGMTDEFT